MAGKKRSAAKKKLPKKTTTAKAKTPATRNRRAAPKRAVAAAVAKKRAPAKVKKRPTPRKRQPDVELEGGWPKGWFMRVYERTSGATEGKKDRYFFSPKKEYKMRSIIEVQYFLKGLKENNRNEDAANEYMKAMVKAKGNEGEAKKILKAKK